MIQPGRKYEAASNYRYGFNGKENDNEVKGEGNTLDFGSRIYDSRLGSWFSTDPIFKGHISPYNFSSDNPINVVDPDGEDEIHFHYVTITRSAVYIGKNAQGGPASYVGTVSVTYKYVTIVENNKKDQFFVHRQSYVEGYSTPYESKDIQFYPNSGYRTKSGATYSSWWLWSDTKDTDYRSLEKITDDFPELRQLVTPTIVQSANARRTQKDDNRSWWNNFFNNKAYKKRAEAEEAAGNKLMLGILTGVAAELVIGRFILTSQGSKFFKFGGDEAVEHFSNHGKGLMDAFNKTSYNLKEYLDDANFVIQNGQYVPELNGYVRLIGGKGSAKYGFVGLKEAGTQISTFHIKTAKELSKKAPSLGIKF